MEALYKAPLAEFVDARNTLAARLRKAGDAEASARVKALPKPSAAAWALNQVYWRARDDYSRMIAAGDRLRSLCDSCIHDSTPVYPGAHHGCQGPAGRHYNLRCDRGKVEARRHVQGPTPSDGSFVNLLPLVLPIVGTVALAYLTVLKLIGEAIGHRPLLTLWVLLVVAGVQLVSLGVVSELVALHHEERTGGRTAELLADESLH